MHRGKERQRGRSSIHWFTLLVTAMVKAELIWRLIGSGTAGSEPARIWDPDLFKVKTLATKPMHPAPSTLFFNRFSLIMWHCGIGVVVQWVKLLPEKTASNMDTSWCHGCFTLIQLPSNAPGKVDHDDSSTWPLPPGGRRWVNFLTPATQLGSALAWLISRS